MAIGAILGLASLGLGIGKAITGGKKVKREEEFRKRQEKTGEGNTGPTRTGRQKIRFS